MKATKTLFILIVMALAMFAAVGCDEGKPSSADKDLAQQTKDAAKEANTQTGYPAIKNFQEKKLVKLIYEERDKANLVCYAYFFNREEGKIGQFIGKCIGYGIPASVQFSNPEVVAHKCSMNGGSFGTLPQPEPNQLFMPEGLSATWLMLINPKTNKPEPVYIEPLITVSPFPLHNVGG